MAKKARAINPETDVRTATGAALDALSGIGVRPPGMTDAEVRDFATQPVSAPSETPAEATSAEDIQTVSMALVELDRVATGIAALKNRYAGVLYPVTTTQGMADARKARAEVRELRLSVEEVRIKAKRKLLDAGKKLDGAAERITAELEAIEDPIATQIQTEELRKKAEREAREAAEQKRIARILELINAIRDLPLPARALSATAADIDTWLEHARGIEIGPEYMEFSGTAADELAKSVTQLTALLADQRSREEREARLQAEREDLDRQAAAQAARAEAERQEIARLRAEEEIRAQTQRERQAEIDRLTREERQRVEREEHERREREVAEQQRILRSQREEHDRILRDKQSHLDRQEAEAKTRRDAEVAAAQERLRAEREDNERIAAGQRAEAQRLADERAAWEAQQETARVAALPVVEIPTVPVMAKAAGSIYWSRNEEHYLYESLGELLDDHDDIEAEDTVHYGTAEIPNPTDWVDAEDVIEQLACRAQDECGEWAEDYPDVTVEAKVELTELLETWVVKYCQPTFWTIKDVKTYEVTAEDLAADSKIL